MVKRIAVAGSVVLALNGCSLFEQIGPASSEGYFEPKSAATQDPYWQRFYELEQEIARLKSQLDNRDQPALQNVTQAPAAAPKVSAADEFLAALKSKADKAVQVIDQAIASLDEAPQAGPEAVVADAQEPADYAVAQMSPQVAVAGSVQRDGEGEVVAQVTYTQQRQARYNYSLVYVYPEPKPWNDMWDRLEAANETDKWRGSNPAKPSYFIYVGAYIKEEDAVARHENLVSVLGEGPEMRTNVQTTALAAK